MKKLLLLVLIAVVLIAPFANAAVSPAQQTQKATPAKASAPNHIVCVEEGTATWCGYCPMAANGLLSLYDNESSHSFYYVALVYDQSSVAQHRFIKSYAAGSFPSVFFDGGYSYVVGSAPTLNQTKSMYRAAILKASERDNVTPLTLNTTVTGQNDNKYTITVKITNTGNSLYIGILKSFVTEKVSRWKDAQHHPYHFGLLDVVKKLVILSPQKTKTITTKWNGAAKHGNLTFTDLVDNNIKVITSVSNLQPHKIPADTQNHIREHYAFFVDQTDAADVTTE